MTSAEQVEREELEERIEQLVSLVTAQRLEMDQMRRTIVWLEQTRFLLHRVVMRRRYADGTVADIALPVEDTWRGAHGLCIVVGEA